eukprot:9253580-Pyramimonas_sp.AAC.1
MTAASNVLLVKPALHACPALTTKSSRWLPTAGSGKLVNRSAPLFKKVVSRDVAWLRTSSTSNPRS